MSKRKKELIDAKSLRIGLLVLMLLITTGSAAGLSYAMQNLKTFAVEVSHKKVDANASNGNIAALQKTESYLEANQDVLEKAGLLRSTSEFPEFKIVDEVRRVATRNNIQIDTFSYGTSESGSTSTSGTGSATPSTPGATGSTVAPSNGGSTGGNTISLTVTLNASDYLNFLQFTYDIEQHLPKMKLNGISVSGGGTSGITVDPVTIEMYIK
jgi:hypothetical protein